MTLGASLRRALPAGAIASAVYVALCTVPAGGLFRDERFRDLGVYRSYGDAVLDGRLPYRDVFVEYPPGALGPIVAPSLFPGGWYVTVFRLLMAACGIATIFAVLAALDRLGATRGQVLVAAGAVALSPLALGPVSLNTYDLFPAALTAIALALLLHDRPVLALAVLAVAATAKLYPLVLLGPVALFVHRRHGAGAVRRALGAFAGVAAAILLPFGVTAGDGLWTSFREQLGRGLHVESLWASLLLAADKVGLYDVTLERTSRVASVDLAGGLPDALAALSAAAVVLAVGASWLAFARGAIDGRRLVTACAAAVAGTVAFGKVLSPQYVEWLIPLVPLVPPPAGTIAVVLVGLALVLTRLWFFDYPELFALGDPVWLLLFRDLVLVAAFAVLARALRRGRRASR
jgi:hypothetical protein